MKNTQLRSTRVPAGVVCASAVALCAGAAQAGLHIGFTGMNLTYNGTSLYDSGSIAGGAGNPAQADSLASVDFFVDGSLVGSLSNDISLDVFIPDVTGISSAPNSVVNLTTPGNPGFFDLLMGTSPLAAEFLQLDLGEMTVTYIDVMGVIEFTFGAAVAVGSAQNLPFGLTINDPVTVSFSAQVDFGTLTTGGGFVTGFKASGTGEFGEIPAPATAMVAGLAAVVPGLRRRRSA